VSARRRILDALRLAAVIGAALLAPARASAVDFLIPGVSVESVALAAGARVAYLVTTESFGAIDSSYIELRVIDHRGGAFRLEIVSAPYPRTVEGSTTVRVRISDRLSRAATPEELRASIDEIRVKDGAGPFREPSERELDDLDLERLFLRRDTGAVESRLDSSRIAVPAGSFACEGIRISEKETKHVSLGGVEAERGEEETSVVWRSTVVPVWGVVKSVVERRVWTTSSAARIPAAPRETKTVSVLLSYRAPRAGS
jgi:hypothetical protein